MRANPARFEAVASASRTYAWEYDADFNLVYVSEGVELVLGCTPEERLHAGSIATGTGPGALMHVRLWDALRRCLREGIPFRGIEVELRHRDGRIVHALCAGTPSVGEDGVIRGVIGTSMPVLGLRPTRSPFMRTMNEPKEESLTTSPPITAAEISPSTTSTISAESARDRPTRP